jgi:hypothetical protein
MYLRESMAEDQEADAAEEEAEEEEAGRFRWFRLEVRMWLRLVLMAGVRARLAALKPRCSFGVQAQRRALSESAWRQRARYCECCAHAYAALMLLRRRLLRS